MGRVNDLSLSSYEYDLPEPLVAQEPAAERGTSRLMVFDRKTGRLEHKIFPEIMKYLAPGDCLVINRTKVVPARLFGKKESGGKAEALFLSFSGPEVRALVKPFLAPGKKIIFQDGLTATVREKTPVGETVLELSGELAPVLEKHGVMPLPPYIKRKNGEALSKNGFDRERYQTVYARESGSIAAPTAGLHFTEEVLSKARNKGVAVAELVLHVGWGTFRPVLSKDISRHSMLPEHFEISAEAANAINACRERKGRVIAVGTTSVRTLEGAALLRSDGLDNEKDLRLTPVSGETSIFIHPGYRFRMVDAMVTNFHLPHSTPLLMVSALAGRERILAAYEEAKAKNYRFYSYGDAMFIL